MPGRPRRTLSLILGICLGVAACSVATSARIPGSAPIEMTPVAAPTHVVVARPAPLAVTQVLSLEGYQLASGAITTFKGGKAADPYFGLYVLDLARKGGLDVTTVESRFIAWGLKEQKADGRFERYCDKGEGLKRCGKADSDDATLARWMHLLYAAAPARMPAEWKLSADRAEAALMALRMTNGIYSVFPHDTPGLKGYALFKDNVEVLSVFEQLVPLLRARGDELAARRFAERAADLRAAMAREFGDDPFDMKRLALGARYRGWQFYPHAVSIPFGWLEGYYPAPKPADWDRWLSEHRDAWYENAKKDFAWGLMALAALHTAPTTSTAAAEPACWIAAHAENRRRNKHWNVLEEAAVQVIERWRTELPACAR